MKNIIGLFIILAVFGLAVNPVFGTESPFGDSIDNSPADLSNVLFLSEDGAGQDIVNQVPQLPSSEQANETILNTLNFNFTHEEVYAGKKIKAFDNKFVFQIEKNKIDSDAVINIKEIILPPGSKMVPANNFQLASKIYEYDLTVNEQASFDKAIWFSIKYSADDYFRKNIYYYDEAKGEWVGIKGVISNGAKKIIVNVSLPKAKVAILENIDIMTEGVASWYKYKGCNCAASPDYPKGTKLKVTNLKNGKTVVVKVNDWGPDRSVHPNRVIDLDLVAFKQIAAKSAGLCQVKVELAAPIEAAKN